MGFFAWLFGLGVNYLTIRGYWCGSPIKLAGAIKTPSGSRVTLVLVRVDIDYRIDDGEVIINQVRLSRSGGSILGSSTATNVASERTGEAWYASGICSNSELCEVVNFELDEDRSRLQKEMLAAWGQKYGVARELAIALNARQPADKLRRIIAATDKPIKIVFTYTKRNASPETRRVTVEGIYKNNLKARDHQDGASKSFSLDRISDAKPG